MTYQLINLFNQRPLVLKHLAWSDPCQGPPFVLRTQLIVLGTKDAVGMPVTRHHPHRSFLLPTNVLGNLLS